MPRTSLITSTYSRPITAKKNGNSKEAARCPVLVFEDCLRIVPGGCIVYEPMRGVVGSKIELGASEVGTGVDVRKLCGIGMDETTGRGKL